jgi:hypothetical protein
LDDEYDLKRLPAHPSSVLDVGQALGCFTLGARIFRKLLFMRMNALMHTRHNLGVRGIIVDGKRWEAQPGQGRNQDNGESQMCQVRPGAEG